MAEQAQGGARSLAGRVAVVAGATRGAGRGIARALGEAGAVVYCTGRSVKGHPSPYDRPETIDETADMIDFSRHPAELLALFRTGSSMQIEWLNALTKRTESFAQQLP